MAAFFDKDARVLVVAPHADDEINCAGAIIYARKRYAAVKVIALSAYVDSGPAPAATYRQLTHEFSVVCSRLDVETDALGDWEIRHFSERRQEVLDYLIRHGREWKPTIIICPSSTDIHQDHHVVYEECMRAFRHLTVIGWESPNNQREAVTNLFVPMSETTLQKKLAAFSVYESQHHRTHFDAAMIEAMAVVRGRQSRSPTGLAEAYEVLNLVIDG